MIQAAAQAVDRVELWPAGTVPYMQWGTASPNGYRPDCSGFVSMCWELPPPGENTETLVTEGIMVEIDSSELAPGDAIGKCGPGTLGDDGHIMLFLGYTPTGLRIAEQAGGVDGPIIRTIKSIPAGYLTYRLKLLVEDDISVFTIREPLTSSVWLCDYITRRGVSSPAEHRFLLDAGVEHKGDLPVGQSIEWYGRLTPTAGGGTGGGLSIDDVEAAVDRQLDEAFSAAAKA